MNNKRKFGVIKFQTIGLLSFSLYVASTYLAQDVIFPSSYNTLFLYLFLAWGALNAVYTKTIKIRMISFWMMVVMGYGLLTMLYSPNKGIFEGQFYFLIVNFIITLVLSQISFNSQAILFLCWTYAVSAAVLTLMLIATGNMTDSTGRLGNEVFGNANNLALLLMLGVMYAFYILIFFGDTIWKRALLAACIALSYYAMFLSGGRKFIVVPIVFLYVLLMFKTDSAGRKHIIKYTVVIAVIVFILYQLIMNVPAFYGVIGQRMEGLFSLISGNGVVDASAEERSLMAQMGLRRWMGSPLFGYGFDSFKYYNRAMTGNFYYSHNNYVELLHDLGLIGFVIYYSFYFKLLKTGVAAEQIPVHARAFPVATVLAFLVYEVGAVNYSSTHAMIMMFLAFVVGNDVDKSWQGERKYE